MKNQNVGTSGTSRRCCRRRSITASSLQGRLQLRRCPEHDRPGFHGLRRLGLQPASSADPEQPGPRASRNAAQGHRVFVAGLLHHVVLRLRRHDDLRRSGRHASRRTPNFSTTASYVFAGDMNGDGAVGNDLIYIPQNTSEMNFVAFTARHARRSRPTSRRRRSRPTSSRTST